MVGKKTTPLKYGFDTRTPDGKRLARIMGLPGFKPLMHDSHVKEWKKKPKQDTRLHDAHVRCMRSDPARRFRSRYKIDIGFRLNNRLKVQIRKALKGEKKGRRWQEFVGYSLDDLVKHLSRMLPKRMTLERALAKGWHIDHIVPKSTYNLADPDELSRAWCLSNLRLIPAHENWSKNDKRTHLC